MTTINTKVLPGFMELLPNEQIAFNSMLSTIEDAFKLFGFRPIETPVLERAEVLLAKGGGETEKQIYSFKKGDTQLAMRFDLTVPLARYVVQHQNSLTFPFKRYAIGKVYRGEKPQAGRFREFYQCDIDVIGRDTLDLSYDAEIPAIIYRVFKELGFEKFTIRVNNRKVLIGLFEEFSLTNKSTEILRCLDKIDKVPFEEIIKELEGLELDKKQITDITKIIELNKLNEDKIFNSLRDINKESKTLKEGIEELEQVTQQIQALGVNKNNFKIGLTVARGLDYYTGTVYETKLDDFPEIGSVCGGGRYDNLSEYYTEKKYPGVGISIGLTRLFDQLYTRNLINTDTFTPTKVLIISLVDDLKYGLDLAQEIRKAGIATELSGSKDPVKKQMKYAVKLNIPYVIFIGEEEVENNFYSLKDMKKKEQFKVKQEEVIEYILKG